jgi:hypothetical protein
VTIDRIHVVVTTDDGEQKLVTLPALIKHCRAERVQDLLEDLILMCDEVQAARESARPLLRSVP